MGTIKKYFQKVLAALQAKGMVGGLEISDEVLRFAVFTGSEWHFAAVRFLPGTVVRGEIKDKEKFAVALKELRTELVGNSRKRITVILTLSSLEIYSQMLNLPLVEGENMEKAIELNIQMVSPTAAAEVYSGWQIAEKDEAAHRLTVLSAFVKRQLVNGIRETLGKEGFIIAAIEPKAFALSRVASQWGSGFPKEAPAILLDIDANGMDFIIVRRGKFYFEYLNQWRDVQDERGVVSLENFSKAVTRSIHQMLNYFSQHWSEEVHDLYINSPALRDEVARVAKETFSLTPHFLELTELPTLNPRWFAVVGSGIRGMIPRRSDEDLSLLGVDAYDVYLRARLSDFLIFWRTVFPIAFGVLLAAMLFADFSLVSFHNMLVARQDGVQLSGKELQDINALSEQITVFNASVALAGNAEAALAPKAPVLTKLFSILESSGITASRISFSGAKTISLSASAPAESQIQTFEQALTDSQFFSNVNLPLNSITSAAQGATFTMTFSYGG